MTTLNRRDFLRYTAVAAAGTVLAAEFPFSSALAAETDNLAFMPATEQIKRFKAGTLSPVDVLKAQVAQVQKVNGPLNTSGKELKDYMAFNGNVNAITYEHFDEAMKAAQESEKRYKAGTARPLEGITVAVKDENEVRGWRVTQGAVGLQDAPLCAADSPMIQMLRDAGAVLHMQTTVPEFYLNGQTWTKLWGVTRNPWNLHYAVGGSSGGSGAALAAGFTSLATGSDIGGSIRIPSAFCGLYGFKPPFGRVPTSETSFESYGPMARTFDDMALMQNSIAGPHPEVHSSLRPKLDYPQSYPDLRGVKIAMDHFASWSAQGITPAVRDALSKAAHILRDQGAVVDEVSLGWKNDELIKIYAATMTASPAGASMMQITKHKNITSYSVQAVKDMGAHDPEAAIQGEMLVTKLQTQLQRKVFGKGYTALIMPTLITTFLPADYDPSKFQGAGTAGLFFTLTYPWNLLSRYPVISAPVGIGPNNVPIGMQIVGNTYDDLAAFRVAAGYSKAGLRLYSGDVFPDYRNNI